jgi:hypothetical protein
MCTPLLSLLCATCPTHFILLILSPTQQWVSSTYHKTHRYSVFSTHLLPRPS